MLTWCITILINSTVDLKNICPLSCLIYRYDFCHQPPHITTILVVNLPSRCQSNSTNPRAPVLASRNVPLFVRAARFSLIFGPVSIDYANVISEEKYDGAPSITFLPLENVVLKLSTFQEGVCTLLEHLKYFSISFSWLQMYACSGNYRPQSIIAVKILFFLANGVHEIGSRTLIPLLVCKMTIIIFLSVSDSRIWRTLLDF